MSPKPSPPSAPSYTSLTLPYAQRMTYRIGRGETGVLTFEPYKSEILPLWRFATPQAARTSAARIWDKFEEYAGRDVGGVGGKNEGDGVGGVVVKREGDGEEGVEGGKGGRGKGDFVGMDMCRKFLQMGMTRATRYANHAGGRKYKPSTTTKTSSSSKKQEELPKSTTHPDRAAKLESAAIFREAWERAKSDERYLEAKERFRGEVKEWERLGKGVKKEEG